VFFVLLAKGKNHPPLGNISASVSKGKLKEEKDNRKDH
jgi:hypothetical protein